MAGKDYKQPSVDPVQQRAVRILKGTATFEDRFIPEHDLLVQVIGKIRSGGCRIAFVTGVWDLFHLGHAEYIQKGKDEAARYYPSEQVVMIIGVDTDEMTRKRKGEGRPVVPQEERVRVLSHVRPVDLITLQYKPDELFKLVEHDVRVVSTSTSDLPDLAVIQEQCEHIVNLPPQAETSTTARIRELQLDGYRQVEKEIRDLFERLRSGGL